ncbi:MAG TPA: hypothetical protein VM308_03445 [Sphingomicrobium sp.]|nr:hypothetical protein [Sphingomicrobium sp.]
MKSMIILAALLLGSCATANPTAVETDPQKLFMDRLMSLCGRTLEGTITSPAVPADADFAGKRLVMHVRDCSPNEIRIPFHVGEDRSRTWVIRRTPAGLQLKHDHRHEDGSEDELSQYGGDTVAPGTARRQEFPADDFSKALFVRRNIPQSAANVWALEVEPPGHFAYELRRPNRFFRVEFR